MDKRETVKRSVNNKLRSNAGESISETLVALLISALAIVMLAGAIATASRIVKTSTDKLDEYYTKNEALVKMEGGSTGEAKITISGSGSGGASIDVYFYENNAFTRNPVIAYKAQ